VVKTHTASVAPSRAGTPVKKHPGGKSIKKPILNERQGRLYWLKRQLVRTRSPEARARLIKQIKELEKDMGLGATEEPRAQVSSPQSPAR